VPGSRSEAYELAHAWVGGACSRPSTPCYARRTVAYKLVEGFAERDVHLGTAPPPVHRTPAWTRDFDSRDAHMSTVRATGSLAGAVPSRPALTVPLVPCLRSKRRPNAEPVASRGALSRRQ
jgi:hypothetical protein